MSDPTLRYFEEEMRYLKEFGKEFANAYPDRAAFLNIDRVSDRDPYVERLFEGFAFLTGKIQQKLDDDLPELTEGLVNLLWPHYLRMVPSLTVLKIHPQRNTLQQNETVAAGLTVTSLPVGAGAEKMRCVYRTTQPVNMMPILLREARLDYDTQGRSVVRLHFQIETQAKREMLDLSTIRLFLSADEPVAFSLRHALLHDVTAIQLRTAGQSVALPDVRFRAVGFDEEDRLWPKAENGFGGYQLLLEYFCFRQKFFFVDLAGLDIQHISAGQDEFMVDVILGHNYPADLAFSSDDMHLFCVPAINLFDMEAEPLRVDHHNNEYQVKPLLHEGMNVEVYSVEEVQAFNHKDGERYEYVPFSSFKHRGGMLKHEAPERYFHTRVRKGVAGRYEVWLMLGGHVWENQYDLPLETLSLKVTGTNGMLPRKVLRETQIFDSNIGEPNVASISNLTAPTMPCYPPVEDRFQWRILSHLAPNYLSLLDKDSLKGALAIYDWTDNELNKRRLNGIVDVSHHKVQRVEKGCIHRGVHITVTIDSQAFSSEAELYFFGELLAHFFAAYADLNLFTRLEVVSVPTRKKYQWKDSKTTIAGF